MIWYHSRYFRGSYDSLLEYASYHGLQHLFCFRYPCVSYVNGLLKTPDPRLADLRWLPQTPTELKIRKKYTKASAARDNNFAEVLREGPARSAANTAETTQYTHFNHMALANSSTLTSPLLLAMSSPPLIQFY
ncbi:hypothetical protein BPAE_0149g00070 [Botrytis paeoniae]|uniref:Uncharacterized protein n=1 Tax=Botrytis paeoniae TaxID=278948 RepID=A0A4Z1FDL2_9HELO|nr:hypothetical protein BPAE_0149g00070 [Botrytis paeoniae]